MNLHGELKVALVHDYLREYGGAERVLETLHQMFPDAPILTAYYNPEGLGTHKASFVDATIKASWLQKTPLANKLISPFRIFAPMIFEGFNLKEYDVVISSCSIYFSKAVITNPQSLHISYIHTPPRYLYGYTTSFNYRKNPLTRLLGELANFFLRFYDFETSQRPDILVANSHNVAARINKFYRRDSVVIYPPVEVQDISDRSTAVKSDSEDRKTKTSSYYLSLSRLVRGKGVDVVVEACTKLGLPLKVAGCGPELESLKKIAGPTIEFLGEVDDNTRIELLTEAKALIVASEDEDFGITAVESQAAGTPVIAVAAGGYLETVINGKTGMFFDRAVTESLIDALQKFKVEEYNPQDCIKNAEKYSKQRFEQSIMALIKKNLRS